MVRSATGRHVRHVADGSPDAVSATWRTGLQTPCPPRGRRVSRRRVHHVADGSPDAMSATWRTGSGDAADNTVFICILPPYRMSAQLDVGHARMAAKMTGEQYSFHADVAAISYVGAARCWPRSCGGHARWPPQGTRCSCKGSVAHQSEGQPHQASCPSGQAWMRCCPSL